MFVVALCQWKSFTPESQVHDLEQMAQQRGYEIVQRYTDYVTDVRPRRPGLDALLADARRGRFDVVLVWACDRMACSVRHLLEMLDELKHSCCCTAWRCSDN